jgi:hypothetical protein
MAEILVSYLCDCRPPLLIGGLFHLTRSGMIESGPRHSTVISDCFGVHPFAETGKLGRGWVGSSLRRPRGVRKLE